MLLFISVLLLLFTCCTYSYQTKEQAAQLCRQVVSDAGRGHILTLTDDSVSSEFAGFPFGIMEYYSDKCTDNGNLILFMSDLQLSSRNMRQQMNKVGFTITALKNYNPSWNNHTTPVEQPRFTLFGNITRVPKSKSELAMSCFVKVHPEAKPWQRFHDFSLYEFHVQGIYYVGGFGGINYIGWIPLELYQNATLSVSLSKQE